ncbi:MAG: hemin receptor [Caldilinea sp. CFX5]|nr:hemin receptor [Caldilinea sp. CFX5]
MNPQQIEIVQQTFAQAIPLASLVAERFYQRLFELDPTLRPLFRGDLKQQGEKLMTMLAAAVNGLNQPAAIADTVRQLGQRHAGYGVQPHHYTTVGEALLWTLAHFFGPAFTHEVKDAWLAAYTLLAGLMQEGAAPVTAAN